MIFNYKTQLLKDICEQERIAKKHLGAASAKKLQRHLSSLRAAENVRELPPIGNPHPLTGDKTPQFSLSLHGGCRLTFVPNHNPTPLTVDGAIDWCHVTNITIFFIGDYHD